MKQYIPHLFTLFTLTILSYSNLSFANQDIEQKSLPLVSYDKKTDLISVNAENAPLKSVLRKIAQQTSLEVLFDNDANENISITLRSLSLQKAIANILRGKNHLLQYTNTDNHSTTLTSIIVLPSGKSDTKNAKRLNNISREALYQASKNLTLKQSNEIDRSLERWSARLSRMPAEKRKELEERAKKRVFAKEQAMKLRQHKRAIKDQKQEKHAQFVASRQAEENQYLSEEQISQEHQRQQQIRDQMKQLLVPNLNQFNAQ